MDIVKNLSYTTLAQILSFLFTLFFSIFVARLLGPEGQGNYALWILIPTLIARFSHFGFDLSSSYFSEDKRFSDSTIFSTCIFIVLTYFIFSTSLFLLYNYTSLEIELFTSSKEIIFLIIIIAGLYLLRTLLMSYLVGKNRIAIHSIFTVSEAFIPLLLVFSLFFYIDIKAEIVVMIIALNMLLINIFLVKKTFSKIIVPEKEYLFLGLNYGIKSWANNIFNQLIYRVDILMVAYFLGPLETGLYSIAILFVEKGWFFTGAIAHALFPTIRDQDNFDGPYLSARISRINFLFAFIYLSVLGMLSYVLVPFMFGEEYLDSVYPLLWLIPGTLFLAVPKIILTQFAVADRMDIPVKSSGPALLVNIALNLWLIPKMGIIGAAMATSISYFVYFLISVYFYQKLTGIHFSKLFLLDKNDLIQIKDFFLNFFKRSSL